MLVKCLNGYKNLCKHNQEIVSKLLGIETDEAAIVRTLLSRDLPMHIGFNPHIVLDIKIFLCGSLSKESIKNLVIGQLRDRKYLTESFKDKADKLSIRVMCVGIPITMELVSDRRLNLDEKMSHLHIEVGLHITHDYVYQLKKLDNRYHLTFQTDAGSDSSLPVIVLQEMPNKEYEEGFFDTEGKIKPHTRWWKHNIHVFSPLSICEQITDWLEVGNYDVVSCDMLNENLARPRKLSSSDHFYLDISPSKKNHDWGIRIINAPIDGYDTIDFFVRGSNVLSDTTPDISVPCYVEAMISNVPFKNESELHGYRIWLFDSQTKKRIVKTTFVLMYVNTDYLNQYKILVYHHKKNK